MATANDTLPEPSHQVSNIESGQISDTKSVKLTARDVERFVEQFNISKVTKCSILFDVLSIIVNLTFYISLILTIIVYLVHEQVNYFVATSILAIFSWLLKIYLSMKFHLDKPSIFDLWPSTTSVSIFKTCLIIVGFGQEMLNIESIVVKITERKMSNIDSIDTIDAEKLKRIKSQRYSIEKFQGLINEILLFNQLLPQLTLQLVILMMEVNGHRPTIYPIFFASVCSICFLISVYGQNRTSFRLVLTKALKITTRVLTLGLFILFAQFYSLIAILVRLVIQVIIVKRYQMSLQLNLSTQMNDVVFLTTKSFELLFLTDNILFNCIEDTVILTVIIYVYHYQIGVICLIAHTVICVIIVILEK